MSGNSPTAPGRDKFDAWFDSPAGRPPLDDPHITGRVARERDAAIEEREDLRQLAAGILAEFTTASGDWYLAGVSREQRASWLKRAGLLA